MIHPGVQFKSVEGDALLADTDFSQKRPYLGVEAIAIHAEIARRIAEANQSRNDRQGLFHRIEFVGINRQLMVVRGRKENMSESSQFDACFRTN